MIDIIHHFTHHHNPSTEKYSKIHEKLWVRLIDKYIYVGAFAGILMTGPQLWDIWVTRQVQGVSLVSWSAYLVGSLIWTFYGIGHKEKVLILTNATWVLLDAFIVIGIIIFK